MEHKKWMIMLRQLLNKYKFIIIILMIGLVLMLLPFDRNNNRSTKQVMNSSISEPTLSEQLSEALSIIKGAGRVRVVLTVSAGEEIIYQTNDDSTTNDSSTTNSGDTVVVSDADRNESGLIKGTNAPIYRGALIVCDGADDPSVALAVIDAVSKVTGLRSDKISVLKME